MKTKVKIHLEDGEMEMQCKYVAINNSIISISDLLKEKSEPILYERRHSYLQTQFNLTNTNSLWLITFDENKNFVTAIPHFHNAKALYSIVIREPYVLIIKGNIKLKFENIINIEIFNKLHTLFEHKITFLTKRELVVEDKSLIINVKSIEQMYPGGFSALYLNNNYQGFTNGFIVVLSNLDSNPVYFHEFINNILKPNGFRKQHDFIIIEEEFTSELLSSANKKVLWRVFNNSLNIFIDPNGANFVWHSKFDEEQKTFINNIKKERPWTQHWTFWYSIHPILKNIKLKVITKNDLFILDEKWFENVSLKDYLQYDKNKLSLVLGTQFGVYPKPEKTFPSEYNGYVFMLCKSLLSGHVACIAVYYIKNGKFNDWGRLLRIDNNLDNKSKYYKRFQEVFMDEYKK
jgi:hypothetical protein